MEIMVSRLASGPFCCVLVLTLIPQGSTGRLCRLVWPGGNLVHALCG